MSIKRLQVIGFTGVLQSCIYTVYKKYRSIKLIDQPVTFLQTSYNLVYKCLQQPYKTSEKPISCLQTDITISFSVAYKNLQTFYRASFASFLVSSEDLVTLARTLCSKLIELKEQCREIVMVSFDVHPRRSGNSKYRLSNLDNENYIHRPQYKYLENILHII